jgi:DNA repair exonuclease SbcCD ATPase subunit
MSAKTPLEQLKELEELHVELLANNPDKPEGLMQYLNTELGPRIEALRAATHAAKCAELREQLAILSTPSAEEIAAAAAHAAECAELEKALATLKSECAELEEKLATIKRKL